MVPKHCFKRDTLRSMSYVVTDLALVGAMLYLGTFIDQVRDKFFTGSRASIGVLLERIAGAHAAGSLLS